MICCYRLAFDISYCFSNIYKNSYAIFNTSAIESAKIVGKNYHHEITWDAQVFFSTAIDGCEITINQRDMRNWLDELGHDPDEVDLILNNVIKVPLGMDVDLDYNGCATIKLSSPA